VYLIRWASYSPCCRLRTTSKTQVLAEPRL
jgi:hypothetical protein